MNNTIRLLYTIRGKMSLWYYFENAERYFSQPASIELKVRCTEIRTLIINELKLIGDVRFDKELVRFLISELKIYSYDYGFCDTMETLLPSEVEKQPVSSEDSFYFEKMIWLREQHFILEGSIAALMHNQCKIDIKLKDEYVLFLTGKIQELLTDIDKYDKAYPDFKSRFEDRLCY